MKFLSRLSAGVAATVFSPRATKAQSRPSGLRLYPLLAILGLMLPATAPGDIGDDNPTGPAGEFNGNVTTGCSYDPYTGNAKRTVTDLVVAGSVGSYPLAFTRISNSRANTTEKYQFGEAGLWRHSYDWQIDPSPWDYEWYFTVHFPDGRTEVFSDSSEPDGTLHAGSGTRERFKSFPQSAHLPDLLILPDGGKVEFKATIHVIENGAHWYYTYQATAIVDPYGQRTTLTYNNDGSLKKIQEPGGRWIQLFYASTPWNDGNSVSEHSVVIDHVQASDGRIVQYGYGALDPLAPGRFRPTYLGNVVYPSDSGDTPPVAVYTYVRGSDPFTTFPLLASCDDPMFAGPMKQISYTYATAANPDGSTPPWGQILSENNSATGQAVSTLTVNGATRTETRGDGRNRTFTYNDTGKLVSFTDFKGQISNISYDGNGFTSAFEDARHHTTTFLREGIIGAMSVLTHPTPEQLTQGYTYVYANGGPYYIQTRQDERGLNTYYTRDENFRVKRIDYADYPNGLYEEFTYNSLGQVLTHRMSSRGIEYFEYDNGANNRGLLTSYTPPATESDPNPEQHPTRFYYYANDRLWYTVDPRGNATWFEYNQRGQTTKVTHQDGTYTQNSYNLDGTLAWTADENHPDAATDPSQRTRYTYDDYKRVVTVTNPMNETTTNYYGLDWANPYLHTTNNPKYTLSPTNKNVVFDYDENFRKIDQIVALGTPAAAWTFFEYDETGNLTKTTDPRWNVTTFGYDERNRKSWMDDPIASDRNSSGHTMNWEYDGVGHTIKETRADNAFRTWDYDSMNRLFHAIDWRMNVSETPVTTTHSYELPNGQNVTLQHIIDAKGAEYKFEFDALGRKMSETYPAAYGNFSPNEHFWYDAAGNLSQYRNPAGQTKHLTYDNRNRLWDASWDNNAAPTIATRYDSASRVISIETPETFVHYEYNDANRVIWEEQGLLGYPPRRIAKAPDADGNATQLLVTTYGAMDFLVHYDYTQRNQLAHITANDYTPLYTYTYDSAGNMTRRHCDIIGDSINVPSANYDELNRPTFWENTGGGDAWFSRSHYQYDSVGREVATWREEDGNKGERYWYNVADQITRAVYKANNASTANPSGWERFRDYNYTPDLLNWTSVNDNGYLATLGHNDLNQYTNINGFVAQYDGNFNQTTTMYGPSVTYNAQNQAVGGSMQATYDGLGRCVKRTIGNNTILFAYDGWKPVTEYDSGGNLHARNIYGPGPDEILMRGDWSYGWFFYHTDKQGSITALVAGDGSVAEKYSYDAFGRPTVTDSWGNGHYDAQGHYASWYGNRFLFTGREWLADLQLYDYRNRLYNPDNGRFLQSDPLGLDAGDMNVFRYCGSDPVNHSDPKGLDYDHDGRGDNDSRGSSLFDDPEFNALANGPTVDGIPYAGLPSGSLFWGVTSRQLHDAMSAANYQSYPHDGLPILRALPVGNILGVLGVGGWRTSGNRALVRLMNALGGTAVYRNYLGTALSDLSEMGFGSATLVGYSRGGVVMVNEAASHPEMTFNLIGIDAVTIGASGGAIHLSANVVSATNFYQQNPHNYLDGSGNPFIGTPFSSSFITPTNYNWTGYDTDHNRIVRQVSRLLLGDPTF